MVDLRWWKTERLTGNFDAESNRKNKTERFQEQFELIRSQKMGWVVWWFGSWVGGCTVYLITLLFTIITNCTRVGNAFWLKPAAIQSISMAPSTKNYMYTHSIFVRAHGETR